MEAAQRVASYCSRTTIAHLRAAHGTIILSPPESQRVLKDAGAKLRTKPLAELAHPIQPASKVKRPLPQSEWPLT
jgi:hypothetical protein